MNIFEIFQSNPKRQEREKTTMGNDLLEALRTLSSGEHKTEPVVILFELNGTLSATTVNAQTPEQACKYMEK
jgi:hypothetical protein